MNSRINTPSKRFMSLILFALLLSGAGTLFITVGPVAFSALQKFAGQPTPTTAIFIPNLETADGFIWSISAVITPTPSTVQAPTPTTLPIEAPTTAPTDTPISPTSTSTPIPTLTFTKNEQQPKTIRVDGPNTLTQTGTALIVLDATNQLRYPKPLGTQAVCNKSGQRKAAHFDCIVELYLSDFATTLQASSIRLRPYYFLAIQNSSPCLLSQQDLVDAATVRKIFDTTRSGTPDTRNPGEWANTFLQDVANASAPKLLLLIIADPDGCGVDLSTLAALQNQDISVRVISFLGNDAGSKAQLKEKSAYFVDAGNDYNQLNNALTEAMGVGYKIVDGVGVIAGHGMVGQPGVAVQVSVPYTVVVESEPAQIFPNIVVSDTYGAILDLNTK